MKLRELKTLFLIMAGVTLFMITGCSDQGENSPNPGTSGDASQSELNGQGTANLPTLIDLGKGTCIPCKKMKPILDELKKEYEGKAIVEIIDLRYDPQAARRYGIRLIPTQIFFDREGNEVYRHEGFMDKQAIKAKFAEMGVY